LPCAAAAADFIIPLSPNHHVTDTAGVLNEGTRNWVESDLQWYEATTGHQVIAWIGQTTGGVPQETWTGETAEKWKIGRRGHDDGALFVFMRDRNVRIEVGYGLESALTDADADVPERCRCAGAAGADFAADFAAQRISGNRRFHVAPRF
jgi:uncharacterized protein